MIFYVEEMPGKLGGTTIPGRYFRQGWWFDDEPARK